QLGEASVGGKRSGVIEESTGDARPRCRGVDEHHVDVPGVVEVGETDDGSVLFGDPGAGRLTAARPPVCVDTAGPRIQLFRGVVRGRGDAYRALEDGQRRGSVLRLVGADDGGHGWWSF